LTEPDEDALRAAQAGVGARGSLQAAQGALRDISSLEAIFAARTGHRVKIRAELAVRDRVRLLANRLSGRIRTAEAAIVTAEAAIVEADAELTAAIKAGGSPRSNDPAWMRFDPATGVQRPTVQEWELLHVVNGYPDGSAERTAASLLYEGGFRGAPEELADIVAGVCERTDLPPRAGV